MVPGRNRRDPQLVFPQGETEDEGPGVTDVIANAPIPAAPSTPGMPTMTEAFRVWLRVAMLSFGGPAGQIAVMHRIIVEEKNWVSENRFLHALNYCMLLPGPEAQQLATYIGWLLHRTAGGIMAGGLFILPGVIAIMGLSYIYAAYGYGGNGITFSFMAAQLIGDLIAGSTSPLLHDFAIDRDGGSAAG